MKNQGKIGTSYENAPLVVGKYLSSKLKVETNTSLAVLVIAAIIRLNAIIDKLVKLAMIIIIDNEPSYLKPSIIAVNKVNKTEATPTSN